MLLHELQQLTTDTFPGDSATVARKMQLTNEVMALDEAIFESYDETIARMATRKLDSRNNGRQALILGLLLTFASVVVLSFLLAARRKIQQNGYQGVLPFLRSLAADSFANVSPEKPKGIGMLRVNVVVLVGLVMMSVSVIAYLLTAL